MKVVDKRLWGHRFWRRKVKNKTFEKTLFDAISFKYVDFIDCIWIGCHFKNSYIGFDTTYTNCKWINTKFTGKYSAFSGARFDNCHFDKVTIQSCDMRGLRFNKCTFSGKFKNLIFIGEKDSNNWTTRLTDCDLSDVMLDNVSFVSGVDFSSTMLPKSGIRVFDNSNGLFTEALKNAIPTLDKDNAIPLEVLSEGDIQELEVFDIPTLQDLFREAPQGLAAFEKIAKTYEVTR